MLITSVVVYWRRVGGLIGVVLFFYSTASYYNCYTGGKGSLVVFQFFKKLVWCMIYFEGYTPFGEDWYGYRYQEVPRTLPLVRKFLYNLVKGHLLSPLLWWNILEGVWWISDIDLYRLSLGVFNICLSNNVLLAISSGKFQESFLKAYYT